MPGDSTHLLLYSPGSEKGVTKRRRKRNLYLCVLCIVMTSAVFLAATFLISALNISLEPPDEDFKKVMNESIDYSQVNEVHSRKKREVVKKLKEDTQQTLVNLMQEPNCKEECKKLQKKLLNLGASLETAMSQLVALNKQVIEVSNHCTNKSSSGEDSREVQLALSPVGSNVLEDMTGRAESDVVVDHDLAASDVVMSQAPWAGYPWPPAPPVPRSSFPPTGPDGLVLSESTASGPAEVIRTTQQMTVTLPESMQKICTWVPGPPGTPGFICSLPRSNISRDKSTGTNFFLQVLDRSQTHVPTAISTPNPFAFPTLSGSPVLVPVSAAAPGQLLPVYSPASGRIFLHNYYQKPGGSNSGAITGTNPSGQAGLPTQYILSPGGQPSLLPQLIPVQAQYSPVQPQIAPAQSQIAQNQPQFTPLQPQFTPLQPQFSPLQPQFTLQPQYTPLQPQYSTQYSGGQAQFLVQPLQIQPQYSLTQPQYSLTQPQYTLTQPQYSLTQPQYSLTQPQYSLAQPQYPLTQPQYSLVQPGLSPQYAFQQQPHPQPQYQPTFNQPQVFFKSTILQMLSALFRVDPEFGYEGVLGNRRVTPLQWTQTFNTTSTQVNITFNYKQTVKMTQPNVSQLTLYSNTKRQYVVDRRLPDSLLQCAYIINPNTPVQTYNFPTIAGVSETIQRSQSPLNQSFISHQRKTQPKMDLVGDCPEGSRACADGSSCLLNDQWCDSRIDCFDLSDERGCQCKDRILPVKICDGYFDCPKGEDELGCSGCSTDMFSCEDATEGRTGVTCIPMSRRCDAHSDCPNGKDESACTIITDKYDANQVPVVSYSSGFLLRNWQGRWYPVCTSVTWQVNACADQFFALTRYPSTKYALMAEYNGPLAAEKVEKGIELVEYCAGTPLRAALWVDCPQPECGIKPHPRSSRRTKRQLSPHHWVDLYPHTEEPTFQNTPEAMHFMKNFFNSFSLFDKKKFYKRLWGPLLEPYLGVKVTSSGGESGDELRNEVDPTQNSWKDYLHPHPHLSQLDPEQLYQQFYLSQYPFQPLEYYNQPLNQANNYEESFPQNYLRTLRNIQEESLRVVGGSESEAGAWPWLVVLYRDGKFHCGATILTPSIILTAAHCVDNFEDHYYEIQAGVLRRFSFSPQEQIRKVYEVILHENYNSLTMVNDVALMKVSEELKFNRWVLPACLPPSQTPLEPPLPYPGTICTAVGWGAIFEHGPDPDHLQEVDVPILESCPHRTDELGHEICAGYPGGGMDTCQGDSGGPLLCKLEDKWYVGGIVSHGEGCARLGEPGVYTRVSLFTSWIKAHIDWNKGGRKANYKTCPGPVCSSGRCFPEGSLCDFHIDCLNGEDEFPCSRLLGGVDSRSAVPGNITSGFQPPSSVGAVSNASSPITHPLSGTLSTGNIPTCQTPGALQDQNMSTSLSPRDTSNSVQDEENISTRIPTEETSESLLTEDTSESLSTENPTESLPPDSSSVVPVTRGEGDVEKKEGGVPAVIHSEQRRSVNVSSLFSCKILSERILSERVCDRVLDCEDGTDESNCTCRDYLSHSNPHLVCDGETDCADNTDEQDCPGKCAMNEFHCYKSEICISVNLQCDLKKDCRFGEDEEDCYAIVNDVLKLDKARKPTMEREGDAFGLNNGRWERMCDVSDPLATALRICNSVGYKIVADYKLERMKEIEGDDNCNGLWLKCSSPMSSALWTAPLFLSGAPLVVGILVSHSWILAPIQALQFPDSKVYVNTWLGKKNMSFELEGPYDEYIRIDGLANVGSSPVTLLHLQTPANLSRRVSPLFFPHWPTGASEAEECEALGLGDEGKIVSVKLKPYICHDGSRCYKLHENTPSMCDMKGLVVCHSDSGPYVSGVIAADICKHPTIQIQDITKERDLFISQIESEKYEDLEEDACDSVRCESGVCLHWSKVADGISDCFDGRDEHQYTWLNKETHCNEENITCSCRPGEMRCTSGECVNISKFCDGVEDCIDGSDEGNCSCADYLSLSRRGALCDGVQNCRDKDDEEWSYCLDKADCSSSRMFNCSTSGGCVPMEFTCDGDVDCPNGEDELQCIAIRSPPDKLDEGLVFSRVYGELVPHCFTEPDSGMAEKICLWKGNRGVKMFQYNQVPYFSVLNDAFSIVRLNNDTVLSVRADRPSSTVEQVHSKTCLALYVVCN